MSLPTFAIAASAGLLLATAATGAGSSDAQAAAAWSQLASRDLKTLIAILQDSHPGAVDPQNDSVKAWLKAGSQQARQLAKEATSYEGDYFALRRYAKGFNDAHVIIYETLSPTKAQYPGFIVAIRDRRFAVSESEESAVPVGATLEGCDGVSADALYETNVLPFYGVDGVKAEYIGFAPYLLADLGNPFVMRPAKCRFSAAGTRREVTLGWRRTSRASLLDRLHTASYGASAELGIEEWRPGCYWIGLPDFAFTSDDGQLSARVDKMNALITQVGHDAAKVRAAKVIVFDIRGNDGGSSTWGDKLLEAIWGEHFTDNLAQRGFTGVEWRTSAANIAANRGYAAAYRARYGEEDRTYRDLTALADQMAAAHKKGQELVQVDQDAPDPSRARRPKVAPRVILLGNGTCFSACNDFSDAVLSIQGAELWGADNGADSVYIDNRGETLASGLFRVSLPMKVWRGRFRGNNVAYPAVRRNPTPFPDKTSAQRWVDEQLGGSQR